MNLFWSMTGLVKVFTKDLASLHFGRNTERVFLIFGHFLPWYFIETFNVEPFPFHLLWRLFTNEPDPN